MICRPFFARRSPPWYLKDRESLSTTFRHPNHLFPTCSRPPICYDGHTIQYEKASATARRKMLYLSVKTLGAFSNWPADMKVGRRGRNPTSVISKMESTSDRPGGSNLLCCCGRPADSRR